MKRRKRIKKTAVQKVGSVGTNTRDAVETAIALAKRRIGHTWDETSSQASRFTRWGESLDLRR